MKLRFRLGDWRSIHRSAHVNACARLVLLKNPDVSIDALWQTTLFIMTFKYLLLTSNSTYRSDLRGRTHRRLLRLSNRLMGYEGTCASQGNLHAVPRQWWMGKHRPLSPRWDHHSTMVFSWSRRWCSHVRRAQRCLACPPIG